MRPFLKLFFRGYNILLKLNAAKKDLFFHMSKEKGNADIATCTCILLFLISIQHMCNTLLLPILPFGLAFKL